MRAAAALLLLALVLRLGAIAALDLSLVNDPADYARHGQSIAAGDGYPRSGVSAGAETAIRPPVYPILVGAAFAVSGDSTTAARVLNALLGTVVVGLTGLVAARLWGHRAGTAALAVGALCPPQIVVGATLLSETTFTALALGAVLVLLRPRPLALHTAALAGVLCGLAVLTRANGAVLLLPLLLAVGRRPRAAAALVASAALVVAPWMIRNAVVLDAFVPVSTSASYTLVGTYNPVTQRDPDLRWAWRPADADPALAREIAAHPADDEVARGRRLGRRAREFIADHPLSPLAASAHNLARWLHVEDGIAFARRSVADDGLPRRAGDVVVAGTAVLLLLALAGAVRGAFAGTPRWLWLTPIVLLAGVAVTVSAVRFRAPAEPFAVLPAAYAIAGGRRSDRVHRIALDRPVA